MSFVIEFLIKWLIIYGLFTGVAFVIIRYLIAPLVKKTGTPPPVAADMSVATPLRLQAYERMILFLERIRPETLLLRLNRPEMQAREFQELLLRTIREEFDYNLSQQIYISSEAWDLTRRAKEETLSLVNKAAATLPEQANASQLAHALIDAHMARDSGTIDQAAEFLKREVRYLF